MENKKAVEPTVEKAQAEGVKNVDNKAPVVEEETVTLPKSKINELIATAQEATALAQKNIDNAENYKKGMLIAKGKLKDNGIDDEEEKSPVISEERIAQIVKETIEKTIPQVVKPKEEDELAIANQKIEEMRLSLANSNRRSSSAAGSNLDRGADDKTEAEKFFSPEQKAEILKKFPNISIEDVYKNLNKSEGVNA